MGVENPEVKPPKKSAAGMPAVMHALEYSLEQTSLVRTAINLLSINQTKGIDCPGCAWPEPEAGKRHKNEYCENGAKHVNDEATTRRITREFFREHSVSELAAKKDMWLNEQGRLTEPMVKRPGSDHYEPISWDGALDLLAAELRGLDSPDEALFYTSGRLSNEAAFLLQLFARAYGTNNLPDCSNMCHETSGAGLNETLGVGKGSVSLDDLHEADLVLAVGLNPGTNMPRMLSALEETKHNGGYVIAVNPLPESGLIRFRLNQPTAPTLQPTPALGQWDIRIIGCIVYVPAEGVKCRDISAGNFGQREEGKSQIRSAFFGNFLGFVHTCGSRLNSSTPSGPISRRTSACPQEISGASVAITANPSC